MLPRTTTSCRTLHAPAIVFLNNHWMQTKMSWQNKMLNSSGIWPGTPKWNSHTEEPHIAPNEGRYLTTICWWRDIKNVWEIMTQHFPCNSLCANGTKIAGTEAHTATVTAGGKCHLDLSINLFFLYKVNITSKPQKVNRIWNSIKCLWGDFKALTLPASLLLWDLGKPPTPSLAELKFTVYLKRG